MPPKKTLPPEKKALLKRATSIVRPSPREPFPQDAQREAHSGALRPCIVVLIILEWLFLMAVFTAGLWLWTHWALLAWAPLVWLHAGLLLAISTIRQFGQWAYAFLPLLHSAVIGLAVIDTLVLAAFATTDGGPDLTNADSVYKLVCLVVFTLFGWIRVGLVMLCGSCCCSSRSEGGVSV